MVRLQIFRHKYPSLLPSFSLEHPKYVTFQQHLTEVCKKCSEGDDRFLLLSTCYKPMNIHHFRDPERLLFIQRQVVV